jgi:stage III sporulation protein AB
VIRAIGSLFIIVACGLLGNNVAYAYARRPHLLRSIQTALQFLETEIDYGATPLPDALERVARFSPPELAVFFHAVRNSLLLPNGYSLSEALEWGLNGLRENSVLRNRELDLLAPLGEILGGSERRDQVKHLRLALQKIKLAEVRAGDEADRNEKMWRYLGFLFGTMLVLTFY